ncbi:methyltransferase [Candidatus Saccharibacteria bacterium]|nr:methyltransferase [Candidatus Saccharibacteria bacterium]
MATNAKRQALKTPDGAIRADLVFDATLQDQLLNFTSTWGLFSPRGVDEGTYLLANNLDVKPTDDCLDLGCGYGPLGLLLAKLAPQGQTHLVDKDFVAVEYANKNAQLNHLPNARAYLSNGFSNVASDLKFDLIVSNIPAKIGSEQLQIFLEDADAQLKPGGTLVVVTIAGLKDYMKRHLTQRFGNYHKLGQNRTYTAASATKL